MSSGGLEILISIYSSIVSEETHMGSNIFWQVIDVDKESDWLKRADF